MPQAAVSILMVDEDPLARERVERALRATGYAQIAHAASVDMARRVLAAEGPFALVILDVHLPDRSGLALLEQLSSRAPQTVVVMITAGHGLLTAIDCLKRGAYDYVLKPIDAESIQLAVGTALKRRQHELDDIQGRLDASLLVDRRLTMLEESRNALLSAICRLAEFGSPERHAHPERVARYSMLIAEELARRSPYAPFVDQEFLHNIAEAALLHDIGKLALPAAILLKGAPLTPEEEAVLQSHTTVGRDICLSVKGELGHAEDSFIHMAAEITSAHHERWDGTGYPDGLKGPEIALSARIVGLADYYDVWRTPQVYRPVALSTEKVVALINEQSGKKFDPFVVAAFDRCIPAVARAEQELSHV
jgi:putative two-component system response regulator